MTEFVEFVELMEFVELIEMELFGDKELLKKLDADNLIGPPLRHAFEGATELIEGEVKLGTPVDTGNLRRSITHEVASDPIPLWGKVGTAVKYAPFVEYGCLVGCRHSLKTAEDQSLPISRIGEATLLLSKDGNLHPVETCFKYKFPKDGTWLCFIQFHQWHNGQILLTDDHLVAACVDDLPVWKAASELTVGDKIIVAKKHAWNEGTGLLETRVCQGCKQDFKCNPESIRKYCSAECYHQFASHVHNLGMHWALRDDQKRWKENNPEYVDGRSGEQKKFRQRVLERDEYRCRQCGNTESLHVHHLNYSDLFNPDNALTLCSRCHGLRHLARHKFRSKMDGGRYYRYIKRNVGYLKQKVYEKFHHCCAMCGATEQLVIHHRDFDPSHNELMNLVLLCRGCHNKIHLGTAICAEILDIDFSQFTVGAITGVDVMFRKYDGRASGNAPSLHDFAVCDENSYVANRVLIHNSRPHYPPLRALEGWARRHHVSPYVVQRAIARHGTKAHRMFELGAKASEHDIQDYFEEAAKAIEERFEK